MSFVSKVFLIVVVGLLLGGFVSSLEGDSFNTAKKISLNDEGEGSVEYTLSGNGAKSYFVFELKDQDSVDITAEIVSSEYVENTNSIWKCSSIKYRGKFYDGNFEEKWGFSLNLDSKDNLIKTSKVGKVDNDGNYYFALLTEEGDGVRGWECVNDVSQIKVSVKRYCTSGFSDDVKSCVDGKWVYKDVIDAVSGEVLPAKDCNGCIFEGKCYPLTMEFNGSAGTNYYCSKDKKVVEKKGSGSPCKETYECKSPLTCAEGRCLDTRQIKDSRTNQVIMAKDCEDCIVGDMCYHMGESFKDNGVDSYCDDSAKVQERKKEGEFCRVDYECTTNTCGPENRCIKTSSLFGQALKNKAKSSSSTNSAYDFGFSGFGMVSPSGLFAGMFLIVIIAFVPLYIFLSLAYQSIGKKAKISHPGIAWIPGIGPLLVTYQASGAAGWPWFLIIGQFLLFILGAIMSSAILVVLSFFVGFVFSIFILIWTYKMIENVGKPGWFVFLMLLPLLGFVFLGIVAWGKRPNEENVYNPQNVGYQQGNTVAYNQPQNQYQQPSQYQQNPYQSQNPYQQQSRPLKPTDMGETIKVFMIASAILSVFLAIPDFIGPYFLFKDFKMVSFILGIVGNVALGGLISGILFFYLYEPLFYNFFRKIPLWGKSFFTLFFIPYLVGYVIATPLMFLWGTVFAGVGGAVLDTVGLGGYVRVSMTYYWIHLAVSVVAGFIGSYLYAKFLDKKLSEMYVWN